MIFALMKDQIIVTIGGTKEIYRKIKSVSRVYGIPYQTLINNLKTKGLPYYDSKKGILIELAPVKD